MLSKRSYLEAVIRTSAEKCYLLEMSETKELGRRCTIKKEFLKIWQNTQENTCAKVFFSIKLQTSKFCEIFKNRLFQRTPPMTASAETTIKTTAALNQNFMILQIFSQSKHKLVALFRSVFRTLFFAKTVNGVYCFRKKDFIIDFRQGLKFVSGKF